MNSVYLTFYYYLQINCGNDGKFKAANEIITKKTRQQNIHNAIKNNKIDFLC